MRNNTQPRRPLLSKDLGEKGESRFKEFCTDAGMIANKSVIDAMGWDYLVEYPYPDADAATPLDKRPHPIECKVQVKTIWADGSSVELKLSAAERLAKAARPSFIIVLSVSEKLDFVNLHVFHMLDQHLQRVLMRLRKATAEGSLTINHPQISFNLSEGIKVTPDGASLRHIIARACGASAEAYHKKKQEQLDNIGFGALRYEAKATIQADNERELAKIYLGLRSAPLLSFETSEVRFGIRLPLHDGGEGIIKINPQPVGACRIQIRNRSDGSLAIIQGHLYLPPRRNTNNDVPFRISTKLFDIFVDGGHLSIDNRAATFRTEMARIKELLDTLKFHRVVASGGGHLTFHAKGKQIFGGEFELPADEAFLEETVRRIRLVEITEAIFKAAGAASRLTSFSDIGENELGILFVDRLMKEDKNLDVAPMTLGGATNIDVPTKSEALLVSYLHFTNFLIAYYAVTDVDLDRNSLDLTVRLRSASLRDIAVIEGDGDAFASYCEEATLVTGIAMSLVVQPT